MKKVRFQYETMTVGELKAKLDEYPSDMAVLATLERIYTPFKADNFTVDRIDHVHPDDMQDCVVIDVE